MFHREIKIAAGVSLIVTAEPGGVVHLGIQSGPFLRSYTVAIGALAVIAEALQGARVEAERPA